MPFTYNLPKLSNEEFRDPASAGAWIKSGRLDDMASSLELSTDETEIDRMKSLPDPWARPLLFNQALTTQDHIAKLDARSQWRGLLALLALRHFYKESYILGVQTVDLTDTGVGNARFRAVLKRLLPTDALVRNLDWVRTGVITLRATSQDRFSTGSARAVGLMVPNCLVAPARGVRNLKMASVPWLRDGLRDPCDCSDIPGEQWVALSEYLVNLLERLQQGDVSTKAAPIFKELQQFGRDCQTQIDAVNAPKFTPDFEGFSESLPYDFYDILANAPKRPDIAPPTVSECEIRLNPANGLVAAGGRAEPGKLAGIVLIDPSIADRTLKRRSQDVRLFNKYNLGTVDQGGNRAAMIAEAERDGYLVITPEQLFTDKLVRLVNDGRVDAHGPKWDRFLLPLSPLAVFAIERDQIIPRLSFDDRGDKFEVRLTLDLQPGSPLERAPSHTVSRFYDKKTQVVEESLPDDVIMWPNVGMNNWPWNFMRFSFNSEYEMAPRFAASMRSLAGTIAVRSKGNRDEALALAKSLGSSNDLIFERMDTFFKGNTGELLDTDNSLIAHRFRFTDSEDGVGEQHILGKGADFLFFGMKPDDGGAIVPAGCLLLPDRSCAQGQSTMDVAVDFGTTNTVVYSKSGGNTERMVFEPRVSRPLVSRLAEEDQFAFDCIEFFPAAKVVSPFPTVMHRRSFDLRGAGAVQTPPTSPYHGIDDNIFFMPEVADQFGAAVERQEQKKLEFDLKWSPDPKIKQMVKRFIRQIILMSTVEAMKREVAPANITWHFSYPQAWSGKQSLTFQTTVKDAWLDIMRPVMGNTVQPAQHLKFETEGAAALRYFVFGPDHMNKAGRLILMFDIGGGTTEIAVYLRGETMWRSSFRIAGGDFFTQFLAQNVGIFEHFNDAGSSIQDALRKFGKAKSTKHFVELFISQPSFNQSFARSYPMFSDAPEGIGLTNSAVVALAGLFYYTGLVLRNLSTKGLINEADVESLTLAFAGRGSSFFNHLGEAGDESSVLGQIARIIPDVVRAKVDGREGDEVKNWSLTKPRLRALFSADPKHEVAHGMLCDEAGMPVGRARNTDTPLGESVELANGSVDQFASNQFIEDIPPGHRLNTVGEDEFNRFLDLLAIRTGLKIKLDSKSGAAREEINNHVDREFSLALSTLERSDEDEAGETMEIEPPFITKLRSLVNIMARNIEERQNLLVVQSGEPKW